MAPIVQPKTTYSDTDTLRRGIIDVIDILDPRDTPGAAFFGMAGSVGDGARRAADFSILNWPGTKVEWLEDTLAPLTDSLAASCTSNAATITSTYGEKFKVGDHILIDSEHMWVSAANTSTNVLTVTRNYGGTQASHANAAVINLMGNARLEGADAGYDRALTDVSAPYNYTQIFQDDLKLGRTVMEVSQYGGTEWERQAAKKMPELMRLINREIYYGQRKSGSATAPRAFGGLETFITDNTANLSSVALTQKNLEDRVQAIWEDGGAPDTIICNAWVKRKITSFYEASVRTTRDENRGGVTITGIDTEFGPLDILMDRWCPSTKLYIVTSKYIGFVPFRDFFWEELAKTGDAKKGEVLGEYTFVVKCDKAHGYIYGISTTS